MATNFLKSANWEKKQKESLPSQSPRNANPSPAVQIYLPSKDKNLLAISPQTPFH